MALAAFMAALAGVGLQLLLPVDYLAASRGMISSIVSLVASLLSIVLGLSVWTSHNSFTSQYTQLQTIVQFIIRFDFELKAYGADTAPARMLLREQIVRMRARFWTGVMRQGRHSEAVADLLATAYAMFAALDELRPTNTEQREHLATARDSYATFVETQLTMIRTLANRVPAVLLTVVLGWLCLLFFCYGLLAGINVLTGVVTALGAVAVASAVLLILELRDPYSGLFRIPEREFDLLIKSLLANIDATGAGR